MQKRTYFLVFLAITLSALYVYKFTDWFEKKQIQIKFRNLPGRGSGVTFYLDQEYPLTSIKVISTAEAATNKYPHALWELVSDSNSIPAADFVYGQTLPGMKPKIAGLGAEALAPTEEYRIVIEAGKRKGEKVFRLIEKN